MAIAYRMQWSGGLKEKKKGKLVSSKKEKGWRLS